MFRFCSKVICCYDGDRAGRDAAWRALQSALPHLKDGVELNFVFLPDGEDPDSLVQKEGKTEFLQRLDQAMPLSNYLFEHLLKEHDVSGDGGKSALWVKANEMIGQIPSEFYRDTLSERLSQLVGRSRDNVKTASSKRSQPVTVAASKITPMRRAVALLLQNPALAKVMPYAPELAQANLPGAALLLAIQQHLLEKPGLTTAQLLEYWRQLPEYNILSKLALWDHQVADEQLTQEFLDTFRSIEDQYLQQRLESLQRKDQLSKLSVAERHEYAMLLKAFKSK